MMRQPSLKTCCAQRLLVDLDAGRVRHLARRSAGLRRRGAPPAAATAAPPRPPPPRPPRPPLPAAAAGADRRGIQSGAGRKNSVRPSRVNTMPPPAAASAAAAAAARRRRVSSGRLPAGTRVSAFVSTFTM